MIADTAEAFEVATSDPTLLHGLSRPSRPKGEPEEPEQRQERQARAACSMAVRCRSRSA